MIVYILICHLLEICYLLEGFYCMYYKKMLLVSYQQTKHNDRGVTDKQWHSSTEGNMSSTILLAWMMGHSLDHHKWVTCIRISMNFVQHQANFQSTACIQSCLVYNRSVFMKGIPPFFFFKTAAEGSKWYWYLLHDWWITHLANEEYAWAS